MDLHLALTTSHFHNKIGNISFPELTLGIHECQILNGDFLQDVSDITLEVLEIASNHLNPDDLNLKFVLFRDLGNQYYLGRCSLDEKRARLTW